VKKAMKKGLAKGLSAELIDSVFKALHQESINCQMKVMNKGIENHNHTDNK
jgi:hypothetical protein